MAVLDLCRIISLKFHLVDKDVFLNVNEDMFYQVWINLINNAIKYTDNNGRIDIIIDELDKFLNKIKGFESNLIKFLQIKQ